MNGEVSDAFVLIFNTHFFINCRCLLVLNIN